jgi:uncharacterized membrane protein
MSEDLLAPPLAGEPLAQSSFPTNSDHRQALPWFLFAAALLLLGLNKQLDLQTLFLQTGREIALASGWYGERRCLRTVFVLALGVAVLVLSLTFIWKQRCFFRQHPLTLSGSGLLVFYVLLRAAAIDHVDEAAGLSFDHRRLLAGMELSGILCLAVAGFLAARIPRQTRGQAGS